MADKQDSFGYGVTLPRTTARVIDAAAEIMGDPSPENLVFLHTVLAQCFLPYRDPGGRDYTRQSGRAGMVLQAGHLLDPTTKEIVPQGLPYGVKPRLLMLHLCSEAVTTGRPNIAVGDSMSAFMRNDLNLSVTGRSIAVFREQLNRLAASRIQLFFMGDDRATMLNPAPPIERFDVWWPKEPGQRVLWPSEVILSKPFFKTLQEHAMPLDPRAIRALQHNGRALDAYAWLCNRLPRVRERNGAKVSWAALQGQFGADINDHKKFRRLFKNALRQACAVYPQAKVEQVDGGLLLKRSRRAISNKVFYGPLT